MASFSERIGITPTRVEIQRDAMDAALRNSLWNVVYTMLETPLNGGLADTHRECRELFETLWSAFFKLPVHEISSFRSERLIATLREPFLIVWPWWKVYDFLEFLPTAFRGARHYTPDRGAQLRGYLNGALEREMSAYRFVDDRLARDHRRGRDRDHRPGGERDDAGTLDRVPPRHARVVDRPVAAGLRGIDPRVDASHRSRVPPHHPGSARDDG